MSDIAMGLAPPDDAAEFAWAVVARVYKFERGRCVGSRPSELRGLPHTPSNEWLSPGSDAIVRDWTDVGVVGAACAPEGRAVRTSSVSLRVGDRISNVAVFGRRILEWSHRRSFSTPEPFERIQLSNRNAYGGIDGRVPLPDRGSLEAVAVALGALRGAYPRNPSGKGYVVVDEPVSGVELPNLEDPEDLLTPERVVTGDPAAWWRQPAPRSLALRDPAMFPRLLPLGWKPAFPPPDDERLAEVRSGELPRGFAAGVLPLSILLREAPCGLSFAALAAGTPVVCEGMAPTGAVTMLVPEAPVFEFEVEGAREDVPGKATSLRIDAEAGELRVAHYARTRRLERVFIPGVHRKIPIRVKVGGTTIDYEAPPTLHDAFVAHGLRPGA